MFSWVIFTYVVAKGEKRKNKKFAEMDSFCSTLPRCLTPTKFLHMWKNSFGHFLDFEFHKNRSKMWELWVVMFLFFLLKMHIAYWTAFCYRTIKPWFEAVKNNTQRYFAVIYYKCVIYIFGARNASSRRSYVLLLMFF